MSNYVQGISGLGTDYNLLVTNTEYNEGGIYLGGNYDVSTGAVQGDNIAQASMKANSVGLVIQSTTVSIKDQDGASWFGVKAGGQIQANKYVYSNDGYDAKDQNQFMTVDQYGNFVRDTVLTKAYTDLSNYAYTHVAKLESDVCGNWVANRARMTVIEAREDKLESDMCGNWVANRARMTVIEAREAALEVSTTTRFDNTWASIQDLSSTLYNDIASIDQQILAINNQLLTYDNAIASQVTIHANAINDIATKLNSLNFFRKDMKALDGVVGADKNLVPVYKSSPSSTDPYYILGKSPIRGGGAGPYLNQDSDGYVYAMSKAQNVGTIVGEILSADNGDMTLIPSLLINNFYIYKSSLPHKGKTMTVNIVGSSSSTIAVSFNPLFSLTALMTNDNYPKLILSTAAIARYSTATAIYGTVSRETSSGPWITTSFHLPIVAYGAGYTITIQNGVYVNTYQSLPSDTTIKADGLVSFRYGTSATSQTIAYTLEWNKNGSGKYTVLPGSGMYFDDFAYANIALSSSA